VAVAVISGLWLASLAFALRIEVTYGSVPLVVLLILVRTFLHTGLFIIAHDSAHGTLYPPDRGWNDRIGAVIIGVYALLPYDKFVQCHGLHHRIPGRVGDPDYHDGQHTHPLRWYAKFMQGYLDDRQRLQVFIWFTVIFHAVRFGAQIAAVNILLFWVLPILLSSLQLFFFGTYLPHRQPQTGYTNRHHARSSYLPEWLSFLTCYHFGYHWEHHEYPHLPWFALPSALPHRATGIMGGNSVAKEQ